MPQLRQSTCPFPKPTACILSYVLCPMLQCSNISLSHYHISSLPHYHITFTLHSRIVCHVSMHPGCLFCLRSRIRHQILKSEIRNPQSAIENPQSEILFLPRPPRPAPRKVPAGKYGDEKANFIILQTLVFRFK